MRRTALVLALAACLVVGCNLIKKLRGGGAGSDAAVPDESASVMQAGDDAGAPAEGESAAAGSADGGTTVNATGAAVLAARPAAAAGEADADIPSADQDEATAAQEISKANYKHELDAIDTQVGK